MVYEISKKEKAIALRKEGKTYSEILKQVSVAKSTLSEWFRDVKLSKPQVQKLTLRKLQAARRGGEAKRVQRIQRQKDIFEQAYKDITHISKRELWLIGIALYWAEGSKEKEYYPGSGIQFGNSDSRMIQVFLKWLFDVIEVSPSEVNFEIYIHENSKNDINMVKRYWSKVTSFPESKFTRIYFKKHNIKTKRRNIGDLYYGGLRITVKTSSTLVRKITGWTEAIVRSV